jgi:hypothetical protein
MLFLLAAAIAAPGPQPPVVQARATVRILSGARLSFAAESTPGQPRPRTTIIHANGLAQAARLIEFE